MGELLPLVLGCVLGASLSQVPVKARATLFPALCLLVGGLASAVNGELASPFWAVFVSFDALLVWVGAAVGTAALWRFKRARTST